MFPRTAKSVPITEPMRAVLGLAKTVEALTPAELISACLKAPVDLLWNGGIGTYVKAAAETHAAVGDKANDGLRVNGADLRARCVGEGGNLGLTQLGRIEYVQCGGRINTDFVDNSAGVDTSDYEVNIKILLRNEVAAGRLSPADRDALLASMTDEVAELVLAHNYDQNLAVANAVHGAVSMAHVHEDWMARLEDQGLLDREIEFLPSTEAMEVRRTSHKGLTAPELATLLAYTKIVLATEVQASDLPDDPYLADRLVKYFPTQLRERYADRMAEHRLRREIIGTVVVNQFVNAAGISCFHRLSAETGAGAPDVIRAHIAARAIFGADDLDRPDPGAGPPGRRRGADRAADGGAHAGRAGHPLAGEQPAPAGGHRRRRGRARRRRAGRPGRPAHAADRTGRGGPGRTAQGLPGRQGARGPGPRRSPHCRRRTRR